MKTHWLAAWLMVCVGIGSVKAESGATAWPADHHMHLASVDLCRRVGECLNQHDPPAVLASDAVAALDAAHIDRGVILSCAYLYGMSSLRLAPEAVAAWTRRENEFTAEQVSRHPSRLVGFFSVDPLQDSAIEEIHHWQGSQALIGLKLHFSASAVHLRNEAQRARVARVIEEAAKLRLPVVVHIGGGDFDAADAEIFINHVLPSAGDSWVQIAHAAGGLPMKRGGQVRILRVFADHIGRDDPLTRHVLFDLSYVPAPQDKAQKLAELTAQMRRIGLEKFLFGSDFNVLTPRREIEGLRRLHLTRAEWQVLKSNCAPWACRH